MSPGPGATPDVGAVPDLRLRRLNSATVQPEGEYVLYWMITTRRTGWNYAVQRAAAWSRELARPLLVFEPLRCAYEWASDRHHRFVLDGMADTTARCRAAGITYYPYVEPRPGAGKGLLEALASRACVVVTDEYPAFFIPRMTETAGRRLRVLLEAADSNGLLPLRGTERVFATAYSFRRFLQRTLPIHLSDSPLADPLGGAHRGVRARLPPDVASRWPAAAGGLLAGEAGPLAELPIDHSVVAVEPRGGADAGTALLVAFLDRRLADYPRARNHPDKDGPSGLSPYLHFGHVSPHQILEAIASREDWAPASVGRATGKRQGWWRLSEGAEAFLDQLVTWRELGLNMCAHREDYRDYESLPEWARKTLREHSADPRPRVYDRAALEEAATHDPVWNAAQTQLRVEGHIHNYLRMLWGKKILEWSASPRDALRAMIALNDKYALDGRDPNSYSGILWILGRYDRPWGPERPIFGKIRYMSSESALRKLRMREYLNRYAGQQVLA
jgi:deoxyribodipyrimidine photo-lyase